MFEPVPMSPLEKKELVFARAEAFVLQFTFLRIGSVWHYPRHGWFVDVYPLVNSTYAGGWGHV